MNNPKENRRLIFILSTIGLWLNAIMFIPFGKTFNMAESIIKFIVLPIVVMGLNIAITLKKFANYRPTNRFQTYASYLPIFAYFTSAFTYLIFMMNRAVPTIAYSYNTYLFLMIGFALLAVVFTIFQLSMDKINLSLTKNQVNVVDVVVYLAFVLDVICLRFTVLENYTKVELANNNFWNIALGIIIGGAILYLLFARNKKLYSTNEEFVARDKEELLNHWHHIHEESYSKAELLILYSLNNYTDERFVVKTPNTVALEEGTVNVNSDDLEKLQSQVKELKSSKAVVDAKYQKVHNDYVELQNQVQLGIAKTELESLNKELETLNATIDEENVRVNDDLDQYNDEKNAFDEKVKLLEEERGALLKELGFESIAQAKAEEEAAAERARELREQRLAARAKAAKVFKPTYEEMLEFAKSIEGENLSVVTNANNTQHKFLVGKRPYLVMQKTNNYYRVTFCATDADILNYLQSYPGMVLAAKSPKGGNFLMVSNTGEFDEELLKKFIAESLPSELAVEVAEAEAKEKERLENNARIEREYEKLQRRLKKEAKEKEEQERLAAENPSPSDENTETSEENNSSQEAA